MEKVDYIKEQMEDISKEIETLRKNQEEVIEVNKVTEIKNDFDRLISRLNMVKKKNQWAYIYVNKNAPSWNTERKKQTRKSEQNIQELKDNIKTCNNVKRWNIHVIRIPEEKKAWMNRSNIWSNNTKTFQN